MCGSVFFFFFYQTELVNTGRRYKRTSSFFCVFFLSLYKEVLEKPGGTVVGVRMR